MVPVQLQLVSEGLSSGIQTRERFWKAVLQDQLDKTHSILIEATPQAAQCLIDIIRDGR